MQTSNAVLVHGSGLTVVAVGDYMGDGDVTCVHVLVDKVNVAHAGTFGWLSRLNVCRGPTDLDECGRRVVRRRS